MTISDIYSQHKLVEIYLVSRTGDVPLKQLQLSEVQVSKIRVQ
jgi:hypothetical protein